MNRKGNCFLSFTRDQGCFYEYLLEENIRKNVGLAFLLCPLVT